MNYYQKNRNEILKNAHEKYHNGGGKEKQSSIIGRIKKKLRKEKEKSTEN